jgi:prolyl-tRNA synthetase
LLKTMLYDAGGRTVAVLVPGDREVEEAKLERAYFPTPIRRLEDGEFASRGFSKGFVGPQGMGPDVTIVADHSVRGGTDWVTGANEDDRHVTGANTPRDFRVDRHEDVVALREGDRCPVDGGTLHVGLAIVVGHIYQLGTNYSAPLGATFVDEDGSERNYQMGSYGIGISRILAAAVEQFHDEGGLRLPKALAPLEVVVVVANRDDEAVVEAAERVHAELEALGVEVALDDREETAGVKFSDADLIGYPVQVVAGRRGIAAGTVDLKLRATGERTSAPIADAARAVVDLLAAAP